MRSLFDLSGRTALVTGSSRGIGRAIAAMLAEAGARVTVHGSRESEALRATAAELGGVAVAAELGNPEAVERVLANGVPDIVVLNASVQSYVTVEGFEMAEFEREFRVNLGFNFELLRRCLPTMKERGWGRVLAVGSVNGVKPSARLSIYSTTKAGLSNLMRGVAREYGAYGITANTLLPGVIRTDRNAEVLKDEGFSETLKRGIPAGRFGRPGDCAGAALLLCSEAGAYITGAELPITGGMEL